MSDNRRKLSWLIGGLALFAAIIITVFWKVLPYYIAPVAPDALPWFPFGYRTQTLEQLFASGSATTPSILYWLIFPPLLANKLTYIFDTLLLTLAGVYYLRSRHASHAAAWLGGLALGFSGYSFTLFSAGHRGYFHMMAFTVFAFGLLARCFERKQLFHFAMLGACLAWGVVYQPDVFAMVVLLAVAYTLWLTLARKAAPTPPLQRIMQVYPRFILSAVVAAALVWPTLTGMLQHQLAVRKGQLAEVIDATVPNATAPAGAGKPEKSSAQKEEQWIFATNWSLPPEDIAEFIVPGIFGNDSFQPPYPYWGRLGRPIDWQLGRTFPNYRQHTVYLGIAQLLFATLALLAWVFFRKKRNQFADDTEIDHTLADIPFWSIAGVIALFLAMGRYAPVYRLFYALPYMDMVRAPVKFHHLSEICTAMLFGLGVNLWCLERQRAAESEPTKNKRTASSFAAIVAIALGGLLLFSAAMGVLAHDTLVQHISKLGMATIAPKLANYFAANLLRSALLAIGIGAVIWLSLRPTCLKARWPLVALTLLLAIDIINVSSRFMRPMDIAPFYKSNVVTDTIWQQADATAPRVINYVTGNDPGTDWFTSSILRNNIALAIPTDPTDKIAPLFQPLAKQTETLWRATFTRYVIVKAAAAQQLIAAKRLAPLLFFNLGQGVARKNNPSNDAFMLATFNQALPPAYMVNRWQGGIEPSDQLKQLAAPGWDPVSMTLCNAPAENPAIGLGQLVGTTRLLQKRGANLNFKTVVEFDAPVEALMVISEYYDEAYDIRVDNQKVAHFCANGIWTAAKVPAGKHILTIRRNQKILWPLATLIVGVAVLLWGGMRLLRRGNSEIEAITPENSDT